jgi:hypothetical protein
MKTFITKIILVLASVATLLGFPKRKEDDSPKDDAISMREFRQKDIVEDFEMAAYHNQA